MSAPSEDPRLTAYALDALDAGDRAEVEALLAESAEARAFVAQVRETASLLESELLSEAAVPFAREVGAPVAPRRRWGAWAMAAGSGLAAAAALAMVFALERADAPPDAVPATAPGGPADESQLPPAARASSELREAPRETVSAKSTPTPGPTHAVAALREQVVTALDSPRPSQPADGLVDGPAAVTTLPSTLGDDTGTDHARWSVSADQTGLTIAGTPTGAEVVVLAQRERDRHLAQGQAATCGEGTLALLASGKADASKDVALRHLVWAPLGGAEQPSHDAFDHDVEEADFLDPRQTPLSTFSIDVDTAAYSLVRRMLNSGRRPPPGVVRLEELINYFEYDDPAPTDGRPFATRVEIAQAPWAPERRLVRIGIKGREVAADALGPKNLVFLLDVSGSMNQPDKLPLLVNAMRVLLDGLQPQDRVAIVVYAGASGVVLPPTPASDRRRIERALGRLKAGGSTNGGAGIGLAYQLARRHWVSGGVNRVILATDGDFNVGVTNQSELVQLVQAQAQTGVFLTVLGFGMGNLNDATLEKLADRGNGNYAYIDTYAEAVKVLGRQLQGTLVTIAKDVKIQVEFNPARVAAYRLIGYENRALADRDFNDDSKDAGEIGSGHSVTALYEVVPAGGSVPGAAVDALRYQQPPAMAGSDELLTVKLRAKAPDGDTSKPYVYPVRDLGLAFGQASTDLRFAAAVAAFGMLLRGSEHAGDADFRQVMAWAAGALGSDPHGDRRAFLQLVKQAAAL